MDALLAFKPEELPRVEGIQLDGRVLGFTLGLSLLTGLIFGLVPAWRATRVRANGALSDASRSVTAARSLGRDALVVAELALALVLLIGAGLLGNTFYRLTTVAPGFAPENVMSVRVELPEARYREIPKQTEFRDRVLDNLNALPGARAAMISELPLGGDSINHNFIIEGRPPIAVGEEPELYSRSVEGDYFQVMGIPLLRGRLLARGDRADAPLVGVINDAMVRRYFPGQNPLGTRIRWARNEGVSWITIVGVVGNVRHFGLGQPEEPAIYTPYAQSGQAWKRSSETVVRAPAALRDEEARAPLKLSPRGDFALRSSGGRYSEREAPFMKRTTLILLSLFLVVSSFGQTPAGSSDFSHLRKLSEDFWSWRARYAPFTGDDVNRLERPGGRRDLSGEAIEKQRHDLSEFEQSYARIRASKWSVPQQVDYRLIGSALARVRWELEVNPRWKRDPNFYLSQTLTALAEALTVPAPYDETRSREILARIENIPSILQQATKNLSKPPAPFVTVAIQGLEGAGGNLQKMAAALVGSTTLPKKELDEAVARAADALEKFRAHLAQILPSLPNETALGRDAYLFFLRKVALVPFPPEELLAMGRQEWNRAVAFETYEKNQNEGVPPLKLAANMESWVADNTAKEAQVRQFLEKKNLLTLPDWVQHYTLRETPEYLRTLGYTETDDFTSPSRLTEDCIRYVDQPSEKLGYFWRATAMDPRPIIVHEGIPGHYLQLCLSWKHEDPIRRHYYDSGANEGIGFYAEEMMLQAGLFDDSPHTREIIYNFMRLRALRVEVDVKLALGEFSLDQAARYLQETVPMDRETARQEAIAFSTGPGQALTYQIGKLQITKMLAEARLKQGEKFNLRAFHDFVWKNGNVPISLQRWELLGQADDVPE